MVPSEDTLPSRQPRDGCPGCLRPNVTPERVEPIEHGVQCHYTCPDCTTTWVTSWWGEV